VRPEVAKKSTTSGETDSVEFGLICVKFCSNVTNWSRKKLHKVLRVITFEAYLEGKSAENKPDRTRYAQRAQTSAEHGNPEDPDFGLWTPGSEA